MSIAHLRLVAKVDYFCLALSPSSLLSSLQKWFLCLCAIVIVCASLNQFVVIIVPWDRKFAQTTTSTKGNLQIENGIAPNTMSSQKNRRNLRSDRRLGWFFSIDIQKHRQTSEGNFFADLRSCFVFFIAHLSSTSLQDTAQIARLLLLLPVH